MANIFGLVSFPRPQSIPSGIVDDLAIIEGLIPGQYAFRSVALSWQVSPTAPISYAHGPDDSWAMVVGSVELQQTDVEGAAAAILEAARSDPRTIGSFGGYYFAAVVLPDGTTLLGTDFLGQFPLYVSESGHTVLFSTCPTLLARQPGVDSEIDPRGLCSLLLLMHGFGGYTLWRGVRRLDPSEVVSIPQNGKCFYFRQPVVRLGTRELSRPLDSCVTEALAELRPHGSIDMNRGVAILQSGGLDSRILAGVLHDNGPSVKAALTLGRATDFEMYCAKQVSDSLHFPTFAIPIDQYRYPEDARRQVFAEGLANGFNHFAHWQAALFLQPMKLPTVNGLFGDAVLGGSHIAWGRDDETGSYAFAPLFEQINAYGLQPDIVRRLVLPELLQGHLDDVIDEMRDLYEALPGFGYQKAWLWDLIHRQRFHIGSVNWRLSFGSWPVSPYAQKRVVQFAAGLPEEVLLDRRLQVAALKNRYPQLARLPIDRNGFNTMPLVANPWFRLTSIGRRYLGYSLYLLGLERRYYYRIFDFNGVGWRLVRKQVMPMVEGMGDIFIPEALRSLMSAPVKRNGRSPFKATAGIKTLIGLTLLQRELSG